MFRLLSLRVRAARPGTSRKEVTYASLDQISGALIELQPAVFHNIFHLFRFGRIRKKKEIVTNCWRNSEHE